MNIQQIARYKNISIDTRTIQRGDIFFAIGNGDNFVDEAIQKGAVCVVTSNIAYKDRAIIVDDVLQSLLEVGLYLKKCSDATIIGITGSSGKTTTKTWLNQVLQSKHNVLCGIKNFNTVCGIPICLSMLNASHEFGIFEIGSNNVGEISRLSKYLQPDVGVITNIQNSHVGMFKTLQNLADEKISIIDGIKNTLVYNGDVEFNVAEKSKHINAISFGKNRNNDIVIGDYVQYFPNVASHYYSLCACIIAIIKALGLDVLEYLEHFKELHPLPGRGRIGTYKFNGKTFKVIDDSYNASPASMAAAIDNLASFKNERKIAIIGEMLELGDFSNDYHTEIAAKLCNNDVDISVFVSQNPKLLNIFDSFGIKTNDIETVLNKIENDDVVLIKASNSIGLYKILQRFSPC